ncbi:hypothetical protein AB9M10_04735 [Rhodococcus erythropolis]
MTSRPSGTEITSSEIAAVSTPQAAASLVLSVCVNPATEPASDVAIE